MDAENLKLAMPVCISMSSNLKCFVYLLNNLLFFHGHRVMKNKLCENGVLSPLDSYNMAQIPGNYKGACATLSTVLLCLLFLFSQEGNCKINLINLFLQICLPE